MMLVIVFVVYILLVIDLYEIVDLYLVICFVLCDVIGCCWCGGFICDLLGILVLFCRIYDWNFFWDCLLFLYCWAAACCCCCKCECNDVLVI